MASDVTQVVVCGGFFEKKGGEVCGCGRAEQVGGAGTVAHVDGAEAEQHVEGFEVGQHVEQHVEGEEVEHHVEQYVEWEEFEQHVEGLNLGRNNVEGLDIEQHVGPRDSLPDLRSSCSLVTVLLVFFSSPAREYRLACHAYILPGGWYDWATDSGIILKGRRAGGRGEHWRGIC